MSTKMVDDGDVSVDTNDTTIQNDTKRETFEIPSDQREQFWDIYEIPMEKREKLWDGVEMEDSRKLYVPCAHCELWFETSPERNFHTFSAHASGYKGFMKNWWRIPNKERT